MHSHFVGFVMSWLILSASSVNFQVKVKFPSTCGQQILIRMLAVKSVFDPEIYLIIIIKLQKNHD